MKTKSQIMAAFVVGMGLGTAGSTLTAPGDVVYIDGGTRVELSEAQASPIVAAFATSGAWTGTEKDAINCVLESKRTDAQGGRAFDAWCSGRKVAKDSKDIPAGVTIVGEVE